MARPGTSRRSALSRLWLPAGLAVLALAALWLAGDRLSFDTLQDNYTRLEALRDRSYGLTVLGFAALYAGIVGLSLPGATVMTLTGGFLFGLWPGTLINMAGATLGATLLFLAVRFGLGQALVARLDASEGRVARIKRGLDRNQWSMLFFIRFAPVIPFFAANLIPALLNVPLNRFVISTFFGILPGALIYTSVGAGLGTVLREGREPDLGVIFEPYVLLPILGLAALSLLPMLIRRRRDEPV